MTTTTYAYRSHSVGIYLDVTDAPIVTTFSGHRFQPDRLGIAYSWSVPGTVSEPAVEIHGVLVRKDGTHGTARRTERIFRREQLPDWVRAVVAEYDPTPDAQQADPS